MNLNEFYQQIEGARLRTAQLNQDARKSLVQQQELLVQAFEELYAALEELQIAEEELRQQNEELAAAHEVAEVERHHYQNLFEFAPDAYLVTDMYGNIRETNRAAAKLLNIPQQFLVGKPLVIFVSKEERWAFRTELNRLHFSRNQEQEWEVLLQPRDREPIDATLTVATVHHREGGLSGLGWLVRPITKRKQADSVLSLLRDAVQCANEAIAIASADLDEPGPRIIFVNSAFTKMTGYTMEELTSKTPRILHGPETDRSVLDQLRRNLSQGQIFQGETINYHKDGSEYQVELSCSPIRNERGEITHFISIQREINQSNRAVEALRHYTSSNG